MRCAERHGGTGPGIGAKQAFPGPVKAYGASALRAPGHTGCSGADAGKEKLDEAPTPPRQVRAADGRLAATALALAACGSTSASTTSATTSAKPITVGISLPLDRRLRPPMGRRTRNGYELWASDVNTNGGLLGRPVS